MKINAKVTAIELLRGNTATAELALTLNGFAETQAEWKDELTQQLRIPASSTNQRAYHIGREVTITIEPV